MIQEAQNKAVAWRYYREIMNDANMAAIDELMAPDFLFTIPTQPEPYHGPEGFKDLVLMLHRSFPDVHFTVKSLIAQNNTVVGRWTATGTHIGTSLTTVLGDISASGRAFRIDGMTWLRMQDDGSKIKITESRANEDTLGLLRQLGALPQSGGPIQVPSPAVNENLVRRYFDEVMNSGKLEVIDEIVDPSFSFHIPTLPAPIRGPDDFKQFVTVLRTAFPDLRFNFEEPIIEGEQAAARWTFSGTHRGPFLGAMPTGIRVTDQGVDMFAVLNARIVTIWVNENDFSLMQQIGLIPANKN